MTVTSMPSRSMSSRRLRGSVMPGRERLSTRAVPRVSLTPTPGRFANCCFTRSRRAAMCGWNSRGRRSCQSAGSPPWPSASITKGPNLPMGATSEGEDAAREPPGAQIVERGERLGEEGEVADRLEGVVGAAAREIADGGDGVVLPGVDRVRGAEAARELELRGHDVDGDDPGRPRQHAALHAGEPDAAEA